MSAFQSLGTISLGAAIPLLATAQLTGDTGISVSLGEVQAKLDAIVALAAKLTITPPSLAASLLAALDIVAGLEAAISAGYPDVSPDLTMLVAAIADLTAALGDLTASASFMASLAVTLGTGGIAVYSYSGEQEGIAAAAQQAITGSGSTIGVLLLGTTDAANVALQGTFGI